MLCCCLKCLVIRLSKTIRQAAHTAHGKLSFCIRRRLLESRLVLGSVICMHLEEYQKSESSNKKHERRGNSIEKNKKKKYKPSVQQ